MELQEAKDVLQLSKNEIDSIQRYLGFMHTNINILADFSSKTYLSLKDTAWSIDEKPEVIAKNIQDFVNIYAAMYKESRNSSINQRLVRGTSNKRIQDIQGYIPQFLSTSTSEEIARTFSEYGDDALAYIHVGQQVPFLDPTPYRSENARDEHEIILAPFCQADVKKVGTYKGYAQYQITVRKPVLDKREPEELASLQEEITNGFSQNIQDIEELDNLGFKIENLDRAYTRAIGDREDQAYIREETQKAYEEYDRLRASTSDFRDKLQTLLKGLCRQKEIEIDQAHEIVETDREQRKAEERARIEAQKQEEARQKVVSKLTAKLAQNPQNASTLEEAVLKAYDDFVHNEENAKSISKNFGVPYQGEISHTSAKQLIEEINNRLGEISSQISAIVIDENTDLETAQQVAKDCESQLDGVSYGVELAKVFPELVDLHSQQLNKDIKKSIYEKVQETLKDAKIQKYSEQKASIQEEKIGFFGKLFGKEQLKVAKLNNLDLKIQLAQRAEAPVPEQYSIRQMLADIRICANTELDGVFTPEMQELYNTIKANTRDENSKEFSEQYISQLANQRMAEERKCYIASCPKETTKIWQNKSASRDDRS